MGQGMTSRGADPGPRRAGAVADMAIPSGDERRQHARRSEPFPILVRGVAVHGEVFESNTVLESFSAGGLYVQLQWRVAPGARLFAVVRIALALDPTVAGTVRSGAWEGGACRAAAGGPVGRGHAVHAPLLSVSISCHGMGRDGMISWPDEL